MKLKQVKQLVQQTLEQNQEARKDNFVLVSKVYENLGISTNMSFNNLMTSYEILNLPSFESICRARRFIVKEFPYLNGNEEKRQEMEQEYIEFAREN